MFRRWFLRSRSLILTIAGGVVVAALVASFAIVSTGYTAQQLNLNDSSVWVANGTQQAIGRANTVVRQLNSVVSTTGSDLNVLQRGGTVMLVDNSDSKIELVDPATSSITQTVPLPPNQPEVFLSQDNVVILAGATGQLWITPISQITTFNSQSAPTLSLGANAVASMDDAGNMYVYSPNAKHVVQIQPDASDAVVTTDDLSLPKRDELSVTSVGGSWAVLDSTTSRLYVAGASVALANTVAGTTPALQEATSTGDEFLVAGESGLIGVSLGGGTPTTLATGQSGIPVRPLAANGCNYAAWTGGQAWRQCTTDSTGILMPLSGIVPNMKLQLRLNGTRVLLNDSHSGKAWAVQSSGQLINNWNALITPKNQQTQAHQPNEDNPPQVDRQQVPPVAVDDNLGARPGRTSILPVLLNDYDPNGDVIVITSDTGITAKTGHVDLIDNRQELQITLASTASGVVVFHYTISDGHGGSSSATVTVAVRSAGQNEPPRQVRTTKTTVVSGGRVTTQILGDWEDPDGDPMYVTAASVAAPDVVTFTPDGTLVYLDGGSTTGIKTVTVTVSDGKADSSGSLAVTVRAVGHVPIIADPFMQIATAGSPLTISPLEHVRGGSATLRLNNVPAKAQVTITPSYDAGTFQFESDTVGTHYLSYVATDGTTSATGIVRVDVVAPPDSNTKPITIPKTIFVRTLNSASVDVADSDIDPSGGVLLVTSVAAPDQSTTGITTEILDQRTVRVTLAKPLDAPVTFNYTVTNGLASAMGTITVVEIPTPRRFQPPIANPDSITVRTGAAVDIPVLANDTDPDGETLSLKSTLAQNVPTGAGLLFVSGDVLRYLAPQRPGNYTAVYQVEAPDGQAARAQVKIAVRQVDVQSNNPPVPQTLTSRVLAGGSVTIDVPLSGIDPDGDTVQLLGQETNPEKGVVTAIGAHTITYQAGDYSTGTDTFTYGVIDALGARATGTVRIGIAARPEGSSNPVATVDAVTVRPGVTVSVQVLANDSDPDGSPLHVVSVRSNDHVTKAKVVGNIVTVKPPVIPGVYGVVYTIANATGGQSQAFVRVTVDPKAPLAVPVASDTVLTLNDIVGRTTLDVNVLANVFFADGPSSDLDLSVYPGFGSTAQVLPDKRIKVTVTAHSQIIPFKVAHPDDPNVFSYAFIWVPGTDDALPQLDRTAPTLSVVSGQKLTIPLNEYVIAAQGKKVQLTDTSSVSATHSDGTSLVQDNQTLQFTSAPQYFGPASISFQVTDGTSVTDPNGRKSILVLPITVLPKTNQPPVFTGGVIDFEPGSSVEVDLVKLTNYPYQADLDQLTYTLTGTQPVGFTTSLSGQHLTITADDGAVKGTTSTLTVGVRDATSDGTAGAIQLVVVPSTKPLAQPAPDSAVVQRGASTSIDVLANDNATNPFPGTPLKVIAIRGLGGSNLPAGVSVTPNADNTVLSVTIAPSANPGDVTLQYEVEDATDDPARFVWGNVTISIEDRPDPVTNVHVTSFGDRALTVDWNPGASNNSAITSYVITESDPSSGTFISTTSCAGSICSVSTPGNGPSNAVHLSVVAKNAIGSSDSSGDPTNTWSDIIPGPPTNLNATPLDHGLDITWNAPPDNGGSPVTNYIVSVDGTSPISVPASGTLEAQVTDVSGIANGSATHYSVSARNGAFPALATWNSASGTGFPAGPPLYVVGNAPSAQTIGDAGTSAKLSWSGAFDDNGASITDYRAAVFAAGSPAPTCSASAGSDAGTSTSVTFNGLSANNPYDFVVFAFNVMGCGTSDIVSLTPRPTPGQVTAVSTSGPSPNGTNVWDFKLDDLTIGSGSTATDTFEYQLSGGSVDGSTYGPLEYGSFLQTTNNSEYGNTISVRVKACKQYSDSTQCSDDWSAAFALGVPVSNNDLPGLSFSHPSFNLLGPAVNGTWTWSSGLPLGAYDSIKYNCGSGDHALDPNNPGSCTATETSPVSQTFPALTVTITVGGTNYVRTYDWHDYD